jgi:septal ring factor EnvC (AmiA/AmiB activator)
MAEELINEYIDVAAIQGQTDIFLGELKKVDDAFEKTSKNRLTLGDSSSLQGTMAAQKNLQKQLDALASSAGKLKKQNDDLLASNAKLTQQTQQAAKASESVVKSKIAEAKASREAEASKTREMKFAAELTNDYKMLSKAYNETALRAKNYTLQLGESHPVTVQAVKDAKEMYDTLYRIDQTVGQNQRNVGNYKSAFDGLGNSFAQVSRELPSLTISAQQFFLAISNNLPMVFDEMKRAKMEIAALKAQGIESQSMLSRVASSLFSWQVGLSIGITLLVSYGKEIGNWISSLFKTTEALDRVKQSQEVLNEAMSSGSGSYKTASALVSELTTNIGLAKEGFLDKAEVLKQYNETIGTTTGQVKSLEEAEQELIKNGPAYIQMTVLKAAAELARGKASEKALEAELERQKKEKEFLTAGDKFVAGSAQVSSPGYVPNLNSDAQKLSAQITQDQAKKRKAAAVKTIEDNRTTLESIAEKFQKDAAEIAKKFKFNFFNDPGGTEGEGDKNKKFFADELKDRAEQLKEYSRIEILSLKTRQEARKEAANLDLEIIAGERAASIANAKGDKDEIVDIEREAALKRTQVARQLSNDLYDIGLNYRALRKKQHDIEMADAAQASKELAEQEKSGEEQRLKNIAEGGLKRKLELEKGRDILLTNLEQQHSKGLINDKEYHEERLKIEKSYLLLIIKSEIETAEAILALRKAFGMEVAAQEAALYAIKLKYAQLSGELAQKTRDKDLVQMEESLEKGKKIYTELANFASGIFSAMTDRQKNAVQGQIDMLEKQKQKDIEVANASIANQQDRAAAITIINARAEAQREQLEKRKRDLDIRRAKFEKSLAIGKIIIETALAVVKALPNYAAAATAAAIGAGQLAIAIATPIPQFKQGRQDGPETLAIVGDGGKREVVASKDMKHAYITPDTDTLTYLNAGDKVFPSVEEFQKKAAAMSYKPIIANRDTGFDTEMLAEMVLKGSQAGSKKIVQAIKDKKELHLTGSYAGVMALHKHAQEHWKYINEQTNF